MITFIWLGIAAIVLIAGGLVLWQRQRNLPERSRQAALPSLRRTVFNLQIGDIVQYEGADWVVEGRLTYNESGFTWQEYLLQDGDTIRWLSVEEDDQVEVEWLETVKGLEISDVPPRQITYAGITYQRESMGTARMTRTGTTLNRRAELCHYFDYSGPNQAVLSIENWGDEYEVTAGYRIRPSALTLLPGDGKRVYDDLA